MANISTVRAALRTDLHDEDESAYRWEDAALDRHLQRAVLELSQVWPHEVMTTLAASAGSRDLDIGELEGLVRIEAVEYPAGLWPPSRVRFSTWGSTLKVLVDREPPADEEVNVYWGRVHTLDEETSTLPAVAEDIVILGAGGYAALELASFTTNQANIAGPAAVRQYQDWGEARLRQFRERLSRVGRNARVRSTRLYVPTTT